jgi:hypothetical protein
MSPSPYSTTTPSCVAGLADDGDADVLHAEAVQNLPAGLGGPLLHSAYEFGVADPAFRGLAANRL